MSYLDELQDIDNQVANATGDELRVLLLKRAMLKTSLAMPTAELDALRAHALRLNPDDSRVDIDGLGTAFDDGIAKSPAPYGELGIIGEALRIYVRDQVLSRAGSGSQAEKWLFRSAFAFDQGLKVMDSGAPANVRAWMHAHAGASLSTLFWILQTANGSRDSIFEDARAHFEVSLSLGATPWAQRFFGLLYAVRGAPGDFSQSIALLDSVQTDDELVQSSLCRGIEMLLTNIANNDTGPNAASLSDRTDAAKRAVEEGTSAVLLDASDPLAAHFRASALYALYKTNEAQYGPQLALATVSAEARSNDQFSESCVSLASLALLRGLQSSNDYVAKKAYEDAAKRIQQLRDNGLVSLEVALLFARDPIMGVALRMKDDDKKLTPELVNARNAVKSYNDLLTGMFVL